MKEYDIVVAGAGPGGATAAFYCAKAGLNVALIDKDSFPRPKPCGGGLCPHVTRFDFIDKRFFSVTSNTSKLFSPSFKEAVDYEPGRPIFYQIEREEFDNHICEKAQDAGAELFQATIKSVERDDGGMLVKTDKNEFRASVVLGATGVFGPVSKYVREQNGLPLKWDESELAFCLMTEIPVDDEEIVKLYGEERTFLAHFLNYVHGGYGWVFPKKGKINIGIGAAVNVIKPFGAKKAFNLYIEQLCKDGYLPKDLPKYEIKGGMLPFKGPLSTSVCDNVMLIGDAAGFVSPISGEGIFFAMDSGRLAAKTLEIAFKKDDLSISTLSNYHDDCMREWGKDLHLLVKLHDTLINHMERTLRYASRDAKFNEMLMDILTFNRSPSNLRGPVMRRLVVDFLKYDLLRMK